MIKRLLSLLMVIMIVVQVTNPLLLNASGFLSASSIRSEANSTGKLGMGTDKASEIENNSEVQTTNENISEIVGDEENVIKGNSASARVFTDFSGIGNQNTSDIGQATYIPPTEETEDRLKTIAEMSETDSSKFKAVTNLDSKLIDEAVSGKVLTESIMFNEYPNMEVPEINDNLAGRTTWNGACWESGSKNSRYIYTNIDQTDTCDVTVKDYGYHYNLENMTYEPIDLKLSIDFVDFFNSPAEANPEDAKLIVRLDYQGIGFSTNRTNEVQFSIEFTNKDGTVINVPTFYEFTDIDGGSGLGVAKEDLFGVTTYYQDASNPTSGDYERPTNWDSTNGILSSEQAVFNYESFYEYIINNRDNGDIEQIEVDGESYLRENDRSFYDSYSTITPPLNGNGTYTAADRGWNRIKFYENGDFITILDSWGANSGTGTSFEQSDKRMITNGKDSAFVAELNSSSTMTANLQDEFFGYSPEERGLGQGWVMKPYTFVGETVISKETSDASGDGIVQRGEELAYTISVKNVSASGTIVDVPVRDSMLEAIKSGAIDYISWDGSYIITDVTNGTDISGAGDFSEGTFTIDEIPPRTEVQISFKVIVEDIPEDVFSIDNVVTDNGTDPKDQCDSTTSNFDCDGTETPTEPTGYPVIDKTVVDKDGDGIIRPGETVEYSVTVTNDSDYPAYTIEIKDSMLDGTPEWLTYNGDEVITTNPTDMVVSGSLADGNLLVDTFNPGDSITITYSLTADRPLPEDIVEVSNVATDDGTNPIDPDTNLPIICEEDSEDCADTTTPVQPDKPIIDPVDATTLIEKSVVDENKNGSIEPSETLTYTLNIVNNTENDAHDVVVRDSMVEDTPEWLTFNNDVIIDPSDIEYSGNLKDGDLTFEVIEAGQTVTITYSVTAADEIPEDIINVTNVATDNGDNPIDPDTNLPIICTEDSDDCAETTTPIEGETVIEKSVVDESGDGFIEGGETLTYTLNVINNTENDAHDIVVRDSMLEELPGWLTFNNDVTIDPSDIEYSGNLKDGDLTFEVIKAGQAVTITYSVTAVDEIPADATTVINVATDNGTDPVDPDTNLPIICIEDSEDCADTTTPLEGNTEITKSVVDETDDGLIEGGETLTYTLNVINNTENDAHDVVVRDSMVESLATWLTFNNDVTIDPNDIEHSGSLKDGDLTFEVIEAGQAVTITYSVTAADEIPADATTVINVATDNGTDPVDPDTNLPIICTEDSEDCADTTTPLEGDTEITKSVVDETDDGLIEGGETLTYTLNVINSTENDAHDVVVRDSMVESLATWLTFNNDVTIDPNDIEYSGSLENGDLTFKVIEAGQTVAITYSVTAGEEIPSDISILTNLATDNGTDPVDPGTGLPIVCEEDNDCAETTTPVEGEPLIEKSVSDENGDGFIEGGETLTYTLNLINNTENDAHDVVVRDSMLEATSNWLTFNNDVTIDPSDIGYSGSLDDGDLTFEVIEAGQTVTITYSVTVAPQLPEDITEVKNVATDNGDNPIDPDTNLPIICPEGSTDCDDITVTVDPDKPDIKPIEGETVIKKSVADENGDGLIEAGETLTYTLSVINNSGNDAHDVVVRDSMLESTPNWLTFNNDIAINPSDINYSGSLLDGNLTFEVIEAGQTLTISYSLTASTEIPADITNLINVATDNGDNPIDPETNLPIICAKDSEDCADTATPLEGDTVITKSVVDENGDGLAQEDETLIYTLEVTNYTEHDAHDVVVRDSMLESTPKWLTYNDNLTIAPNDIKYNGNIIDGNLMFELIEAGQTVTMSYSINVDANLSNKINSIDNIATDNGQDPTTVNPALCESDLDCSSTETPVEKEVKPLAITGGKSLFILVDLVLILIAMLVVKNKVLQ